MTPAAVKDWKAINKSRPEVEKHFLGNETIGVYPLLLDETCWFLAADFDKKTWEYDAQAFLETFRQLGVPAILERYHFGRAVTSEYSLIDRCRRLLPANWDA